MMSFLIPLSIFLFLGVAAFSAIGFSYVSAGKELLKRCDSLIIDKIPKVKIIGFEEKGQKHSFPSYFGLQKCTISFGNNFIIFTPVAKFPNIFNCFSPFVIAKDSVLIANNIRFSKVFKPTKAKPTNYNGDFEFCFVAPAIFGDLKMTISLINLTMDQLEKLSICMDWSRPISE